MEVDFSAAESPEPCDLRSAAESPEPLATPPDDEHGYSRSRYLSFSAAGEDRSDSIIFNMDKVDNTAGKDEHMRELAETPETSSSVHGEEDSNKTEWSTPQKEGSDETVETVRESTLTTSPDQQAGNALEEARCDGYPLESLQLYGRSPESDAQFLLNEIARTVIAKITVHSPSVQAIDVNSVRESAIQLLADCYKKGSLLGALSEVQTASDQKKATCQREPDFVAGSGLLGRWSRSSTPDILTEADDVRNAIAQHLRSHLDRALFQNCLQPGSCNTTALDNDSELFKLVGVPIPIATLSQVS